MKKLLLALVLLLAPAAAWAQCSGVFPANTICGNNTASPAVPTAVTFGGAVSGPGSTVVGHFATWNNTIGTLLADYDLFGSNNTFTGSNTFSTGTDTFSGTANFTGTFKVGGQTFLFPAAGTTVGGLGTNQTWTGTNTFSNTVNMSGTFEIGGTTFSLPVSVPNGGTGNTTATAHSIPINQGASSQTNTGTGTTGQCLVSAGASANPAFTSGCRVLLNTLTASASASLSDTTSLTSTYNTYEIVFENLLPGTDNVTLQFQVHSSGAFQATNYFGTINYVGSTTNVANVTTFIPLSATSLVRNSGAGFSGVLRIIKPSQTTAAKNIFGYGGAYNGTLYNITQFGGIWNGDVTAVDGFRVLFGAGTITSGIVEIYGIL